MNKSIRLSLIILAIALMLSFVSGCGGAVSAQSTKESVNSDTASDTTAMSAENEITSAESASDEEKTETSNIPLSQEKVTLDFLAYFTTDLSKYIDDYGDNFAMQEAEKLTNVHINWKVIDAGSMSTTFNLMLASGDYTDMALGAAPNYPGGGSQGIEDGVLEDIALYLKDDAPNYSAIVDADPGNAREAKDDSGRMPCFVNFSENYDSVSSGHMIRQDWLDKLGLDTPVTYDDYYTVLKAFKTEYNISDPYYMDQTCSTNNGCLAGGYGVIGYSLSEMSHLSWYQIDGKVHNSLTEDGFKNYLEMLNKWYKESLIGTNFYSYTENMMSSPLVSLVTTGQVGIYSGRMLSDTTTYLKSLKETAGNENARLVGIPHPVLKEGEIQHFGKEAQRIDGVSVSVFQACDNIDTSVKWLDFWYSDIGQMYANYGIEGLSYNMVDGKAEFTDVVLNNPEGMSQAAALGLYTTVGVTPTVTDGMRTSSTYTDDMLKSIDVWTASTDGAYMFPQVSLTSDENENFTNAYADISTYANENIIKFVTGETDFSQWETFKTEMNSMGLNECVEIYQTALDRYNKR